MLIDRLVFSSWFRAFVAALAITCGLLLMENVQNELGDFLEWGAEASEIFTFYTAYTIQLLPIVIPVSFMLSLIFSLSQLHRNNELVAMHTAGVGRHRATRALWLTALALCGFLVAANAVWVPAAMDQTTALRDGWRRASKTVAAASVPTLGFHAATDGRLWLMNRFDPVTNQAFGVSISVRDPLGRQTHEYFAQEAYFDEVSSHWILVNVRVRQFDPNSGDAVVQRMLDRSMQTEWKEPPWLMLALNTQTDKLPLRAIERVLDALGSASHPRKRSLEVRSLQVRARPLACLVVIAFAVPLACRGVRVNPLIGSTQAGLAIGAYLIIEGTFGLLAEQGSFEPIVAALAPPAIALAASLPLNWQN